MSGRLFGSDHIHLWWMCRREEDVRKLCGDKIVVIVLPGIHRRVVQEDTVIDCTPKVMKRLKICLLIGVKRPPSLLTPGTIHS